MSYSIDSTNSQAGPTTVSRPEDVNIFENLQAPRFDYRRKQQPYLTNNRPPTNVQPNSTTNDVQEGSSNVINIDEVQGFSEDETSKKSASRPKQLTEDHLLDPVKGIAYLYPQIPSGLLPQFPHRQKPSSTLSSSSNTTEDNHLFEASTLPPPPSSSSSSKPNKDSAEYIHNKLVSHYNYNERQMAELEQLDDDIDGEKKQRRMLRLNNQMTNVWQDDLRLVIGFYSQWARGLVGSGGKTGSGKNKAFDFGKAAASIRRIGKKSVKVRRYRSEFVQEEIADRMRESTEAVGAGDGQNNEYNNNGNDDDEEMFVDGNNERSGTREQNEIERRLREARKEDGWNQSVEAEHGEEGDNNEDDDENLFVGRRKPAPFALDDDDDEDENSDAEVNNTKKSDGNEKNQKNDDDDDDEPMSSQSMFPRRSRIIFDEEEDYDDEDDDNDKSDDSQKEKQSTLSTATSLQPKKALMEGAFLIDEEKEQGKGSKQDSFTAPSSSTQNASSVEEAPPSQPKKSFMEGAFLIDEDEDEEDQELDPSKHGFEFDEEQAKAMEDLGF